MRVVAGEMRGRRIESPEGRDTRPTTDKVREAMFNSLGSLDLIRDATVADLFAGSGALGIEAISRGAAHCTFVERDRSALRVLRNNIEHLGIGDRAKVVTTDAVIAAATIGVDLVIADPPYQFDEWPRLLAAVRAPFVVAEAGKPLDAIDAPGWAPVRPGKRYGRTWVTFFGRIDAES